MGITWFILLTYQHTITHFLNIEILYLNVLQEIKFNEADYILIHFRAD